MSFRILRGFLNTVVSDSKIEKLKVGWQGTAKREHLEEYRRASRKAFFLDEDEEFYRHAQVAIRIREENKDLRLLIEVQRKRREE